jgi:hypothetical protein
LLRLDNQQGRDGKEVKSVPSEQCRNASIGGEVAEDRLVVGVYLGIDANDVVDESDLVGDERVDGDMVGVWQQQLDCGCGRLILTVIAKGQRPLCPPLVMQVTVTGTSSDWLDSFVSLGDHCLCLYVCLPRPVNHLIESHRIRDLERCGALVRPTSH